MSAIRTQRFLAACLVAATLAAVVGSCSGHQPAPQSGIEPKIENSQEFSWNLSPKATVIYDFLLFEDLKRSPKSEEAEDAIRQVLQLNPAPQMYIEAANYYWTKQDLGTAISYLKKGIESFPSDFNLYLYLASVYMAEKRYGDAATTLQDYLARDPKDVHAKEALGQVYLDGQRYQQALDTLQSIPEKERSAQTTLAIAQAKAKLGLTHQSIATLQKLLEKNPDLMEAWAELAYLYEVDKNYEAAEKAYGRILELGENEQEVWLRLIKLNLKLNNPNKAMALAMEAPQTVSFIEQAATAFITEGFFEQAETVLEPLSEKHNPPSELYFYQAVIAAEGRNDPAKALEALDKIPVGDPIRGRVLPFRAHLLYAMGRKEESLALVNEGKKEPDAPKDLWELQAAMYEADKNYDGALNVLREAEAKWPNDTDILFKEGAMEERKGNRAEALKIMERILASDPDNAEALNFVGYSLAESGKELDRALAMIKSAMGQKPDSGFIVDSLAWVYFKMGRTEAAWREINRAVSLLADDPTVWEHYGDIAKAMGRKKDAAKGYRESLRRDPGNRDQIEQKLKSL